MVCRHYMKNISELCLCRYKFIVYYAETLDSDIAEFPHHHPLYEIYYVQEGSILIEIDGKEERIEKGNACFLSKDIEHHVKYEPDLPHKYFALIFDLVLLDTNTPKGPDGPMEYQDIINVMDILNEKMYLISPILLEDDLLVSLFREIKERKLGWNSQAVIICYQFFIHAIRRIATMHVLDKQFSGKENMAMSASKYIHKYYQKEISVQSVASDLNVTPRHINRAYKSMFSTTFMKNTNLLRIAYAKKYLCSTDDTIEDIAEKIGFSSSRVLYKLFKKYEGNYISQYRELHHVSDVEDTEALV